MNTNTYTVIGVWMRGEPVPVGVIAGSHDVGGGDTDIFDEGLWATSVEATDLYTAEVVAIATMMDGDA